MTCKLVNFENMYLSQLRQKCQNQYNNYLLVYVCSQANSHFYQTIDLQKITLINISFKCFIHAVLIYILGFSYQCLAFFIPFLIHSTDSIYFYNFATLYYVKYIFKRPRLTIEIKQWKKLFCI